MIGYYAHHHGSGHSRRAESLATELHDDVVILSSLPGPDTGTQRLLLPRDDDVAPGRDPRATGSLHWAPLDSAGYSERMAMIAAWVREARPRVVVVDVSVEVTALVRLLGVPVCSVVMPGDRTDAPHQLGMSLSTRLLAFWPEELCVPAWLEPHRDRTDFVGVVSSYERRASAQPSTGQPPDSVRAPAESQGSATPRRKVLLVMGAGGTEVTQDDIDNARRSTPGWEWKTVGGDGVWVEDLWPELLAADVVVTHAGQNAIADVAAAHRQAVVLPQSRPHDEQHATADVLERRGIATVRRSWPTDWGAVLEEAAAREDRWDLLRADGATARAARAIEAVGR